MSNSYNNSRSNNDYHTSEGKRNINSFHNNNRSDTITIDEREAHNDSRENNGKWKTNFQ